ncbi:MAG: hypothetical protein OXN18_08285 [Gemmatimonadota bacterium]|nr:hypothetical protein [Gemmatimonadota bacterium]
MGRVPREGAGAVTAGIALALMIALGGAGQQDDEWRTLAGSSLTARYQGVDSLRASRALVTLDALGQLPGLRETGMRVVLTVAPTREVMDSLVGGRVPEWAGAVAIPERMEMIIPGGRFWPPSPLDEARILRHEWAHLALAHEMGDLRIPRWFNEGYAEWTAGAWLDGGARKLGMALVFGDGPPLDSLTLGWPRERVPAELAYLLSASVIQYLVESSGRRGLETFLAEWKRRRSYDAALRGVYGATPAQLESDWRRWVKRRYGWLIVLSDSALFWAVLAAALTAMFLVRRRYRREQMARLRAGEPPDAPPFWVVADEGPGRTRAEPPVDRRGPSR